jgi:CheY-like chemotaxis protein/HPt (histidine-containing phosphotransfer) domain-containing protein
MGGTIGVESEEGAGSTFWFTAVVAKQTDADHVRNVAQYPEAKKPGDVTCDPPRHIPRNSSRITGTAARLLLAEDDVTNQMVTLSLLTKFGYRVDVANNGAEALRMLECDDYALVLMDCMMPIMSGYEATAIIRDQTSAVRNHAIPVIALTANAFAEDRDSCLTAGMNDYLAKPLEFEHLVELLKKWMPADSAREAENHGTMPGSHVISAISSRDVFDVDDFVRRNLGDRELSRDVAVIFVNSAPEYIASIRLALTAGNADALRISAHKLKGAAASLVLTHLSDIAAKIESLARDGDLKQAVRLMPDVERRFEQAADALHELLITPRENENIPTAEDAHS